MKTIFIYILFCFLVGNSTYHESLFFFSNRDNEVKLNIDYNSSEDGLKALAYSALIPGSGQLLINKDDNKALIFLGLELAGWFLYDFYSTKGDIYKNEYQKYGNQHWGFDTWCTHYYDWENPDNEFFDIFSNNESGVYPNIWEGSHHIDFYYTDNNNIRTFVNSSSDTFELIWSEYDLANNAELFMDENDVIIYKDHHFYENIVKYNHFFSGWDDQDQIEMRVNSNGYKTAFSPNKTYYRALYNKSVKHYQTKGNIASFILINHFASMLDALIINRISSNKVSVSYNYDKIINFHQAELIIKLN